MKKPNWVERFEEIEEQCPEFLPTYVMTDEDQTIYFPQYEQWKRDMAEITKKRKETLAKKRKS